MKFQWPITAENLISNETSFTNFYPAIMLSSKIRIKNQSTTERLPTISFPIFFFFV